MFDAMRVSGSSDAEIVTLLRQCGDARSLAQAKQLHSYAVATGKDRTTFVANLIIQMYGKCGSTRDAAQVFTNLYRKNLHTWNIMLAAFTQNGEMLQALDLFDKMPQRNLVSWNSIISGCSQNGPIERVTRFYLEVLLEGFRPDKITLVAVLQSCTGLPAGEFVFSHVVELRLESDVVVATALVTMFGRCGSVQIARDCFERVKDPDVVLCNAMITANCHNGRLEDATALFAKLGESSRDVASYTAMVAGFAENGRLREAREVFEMTPEKNIVSWNAIMGAYAHCGHYQEALQLFERMQCQSNNSGALPNRITCVTLLDVCGNLRELEQGKRVHELATAAGFDADAVLRNTLVSMYGRCGDLESARRVFDETKMRGSTTVTWNVMLAALAQNGHCAEVVRLLRVMDLEGVRVNEITLSTFFDACGESSALDEGRIVHGDILCTGFGNETVVCNSLVSMYGKCSRLDDAERTFNCLVKKNVVSWTGMITAFAQNGKSAESLTVLHRMSLEGVEPNEVTFVSVLSGCSHAGLSEQGLRLFGSMNADYNVQPLHDHYICVVDALGRNGQVDEAERLVGSLPFEPHPTSLTSLLGACKVQGVPGLGFGVARQMRMLEPEKDASYVMESSLCSLF